MSRNETIRGRGGRRAAAVVGTALATLAFVVTLAPLAGAQTDPGGDGHPPRLTDAQKTCLTQHGVTLPTRTPGQAPTPPTDQQRQAFEAAAKTCGVQPPTMHRVRLTDAQKTCLSQHGITPPAPGSAKPAPPTAEQRAAFEAAAKTCGIQLPPKPATTS
jgi:hypothetical protein